MVKVMIVDDEPYIRKGLQILINWEHYGFDICGEAGSGIEAVELMKKKDFDLIITDIKMPQMDGLELIEYTKKNISKDIRFIILSGFYEFEFAKKAIRYDVADYILKPVQKEELIKVLEDCKEQLYRQAEDRKKLEFSDKIVFDRYINQFISGQQTREGMDYVSRYLVDSNNIRYISIEYDLISDDFSSLSGEDKIRELNLLYDTVKVYLGSHWYHAIMDSNRIENTYAVGFIYAKKLADLSGCNEKEYISRLYDKIQESLAHQVMIYIGQKVTDISMISDSYKSAAIAKSFQQFSSNKEIDKDIAYFDDIKYVSTSRKPLNKKMMDELVKAIEENDILGINHKIEGIYNHFKEMVTDPEIIKLNLDYLLFQLINLTKELDPDIEQEEVYKMISQGGFDQIGVRGSMKHFQKLAYDYAAYLTQIRQHSFGGVLTEIEKEITEHYMDNLSLKYLSEKYYINSAYLGQIFKKQYGISFKDYLNNYRIDCAAELLKRSDVKIYHVANAVGFNNTDYFISKFVQLKGITPLQYRKQLLGRRD